MFSNRGKLNGMKMGRHWLDAYVPCCAGESWWVGGWSWTPDWQESMGREEVGVLAIWGCLPRNSSVHRYQINMTQLFYLQKRYRLNQHHYGPSDWCSLIACVSVGVEVVHNLSKKLFEIKRPFPSPHKCQLIDLATPLTIHPKGIIG